MLAIFLATAKHLPIHLWAQERTSIYLEFFGGEYNNLGISGTTGVGLVLGNGPLIYHQHIIKPTLFKLCDKTLISLLYKTVYHRIYAEHSLQHILKNWQRCYSKRAGKIVL